MKLAVDLGTKPSLLPIETALRIQNEKALMMKKIVLAVLILFYLLHNDFWLWYDDCLWGGLPSGLLYHLVYCFAAAVLMMLLIRFAWPIPSDGDSGAEES